jgi:hypothetical protein
MYTWVPGLQDTDMFGDISEKIDKVEKVSDLTHKGSQIR